MKKQSTVFLALLLALSILFSAVPAMAAAPLEPLSGVGVIGLPDELGAVSLLQTDENVMSLADLARREKMLAMRTDYPEGMPWTNDNFYAWTAGIFSGGYGCAGFAMILSDAAYGRDPRAIKLTEFSYDDVRVGDTLRINGDTHSVAVLEKHVDHVVIAEGNYNRSIHWGRTLSKAKVEQADYVLTRDVVDPDPAVTLVGPDTARVILYRLPESASIVIAAARNSDGRMTRCSVGALNEDKTEITFAGKLPQAGDKLFFLSDTYQPVFQNLFLS